MKRTTKEEVFQRLAAMCQGRKENHHTYRALMEFHPAQCGPFAGEIACTLNVSAASVRRYLGMLESEGRVVRHMPYFCTARWYVPIEGEEHGARDYRKEERIRNKG